MHQQRETKTSQHIRQLQPRHLIFNTISIKELDTSLLLLSMNCFPCQPFRNIFLNSSFDFGFSSSTSLASSDCALFRLGKPRVCTFLGIANVFFPISCTSSPRPWLAECGWGPLLPLEVSTETCDSNSPASLLRLSAVPAILRSSNNKNERRNFKFGTYIKSNETFTIC